MWVSRATIARALRFLIRQAIITASPMLVSLAKLIRDYESGREDMTEYVANNDVVAQEYLIGKQFREVCFICKKVLSPLEGQINLTTAMYMLEEHRRKMGKTYQRFVDMEAVSTITTRYKNGRVSKEPEYPNGELYFDHCVYGFLLDLMHAAQHIRFKNTQPQDPAVRSIYDDYLTDACEFEHSDPNPQIMFSNWSRIKTNEYGQCVDASQQLSDALWEGDEVSSGGEMSDDEASTGADDRVLSSGPNSKNPFILLSDVSSQQVLRNNAIIASSSHVANSTILQAPSAPQISDMFGLWFPSSQASFSETNCEGMQYRQEQEMMTSRGTPRALFEKDQPEESVSLGTSTPSTLSPMVRCYSPPCEELPSLQELPPAGEAACALSQGSMFESHPHKVDSAIMLD